MGSSSTSRTAAVLVHLRPWCTPLDAGLLFTGTVRIPVDTSPSCPYLTLIRLLSGVNLATCRQEEARNLRAITPSIFSRSCPFQGSSMRNQYSFNLGLANYVCMLCLSCYQFYRTTSEPRVKESDDDECDALSLLIKSIERFASAISRTKERGRNNSKRSNSLDLLLSGLQRISTRSTWSIISASTAEGHHVRRR